MDGQCKDSDLALALSLHEKRAGNNFTEDLDQALAASLQEQYDSEEVKLIAVHDPPVVRELPQAKRIVDDHWELTDPNPNIHQMFVDYDSMFFGCKLIASGVAVDWSKRMTLCAGICSYEGKVRFCSIRLSQPLLKLRPRRDLVETLLHEMIHAYLFVTHNNKDHDGHGPQFLFHMNRINKAANTKVSVLHSFHQEVSHYRQHWWKCNGPCQKWPPYFGIVKRAMNRAPAPRDLWWEEHQRKCGGNYAKIKEPDGYGKKAAKRKQGRNDGNRCLKKMLQGGNGGEPSNTAEFSGIKEPNKIKFPPPLESTTGLTAFTGRGFVLSTNVQKQEDQDSIRNKMLKAAEKRKMESNLTAGSRQHGVKRKSGTLSQKGFDTASISKKSCLQDKGAKCIWVQGSSNVDKEDIPVINIPDDALSKSSGPSSPDVLVTLEEDCESTDDDFKTCPLCGMSNIPSAIINIHISLCLEVEDQLQFVDDEEL